MLCRFLAFSELLRDAGGAAGLLVRKALEFSWPEAPGSFNVDGAEFAELEERAFKARFEGLLGEPRVRVVDFGTPMAGALTANLDDDLAERSDSLTLGRNGVARGVCDCAKRLFCGDVTPTANWWEAILLKEGDAGVEEFCELVELADASELCEPVRASWNFEGERDIDRLKDRTAAWTSM